MARELERQIYLLEIDPEDALGAVQYDSLRQVRLGQVFCVEHRVPLEGRARWRLDENRDEQIAVVDMWCPECPF